MASVGKKNMVISFSGGRTSAFMTQWLLKNKSNEYNFYVIFSNTGRENEKTLEFIENCDKYFGFNVIWIEPLTNPKMGIGMRAKQVDFVTANRSGKPFEDVISKYSIPNRTSPFCSEYMKKNTIRAYCRDVLGFKKIKQYQTAIGIRVDEIDRQSENKKKENLVYPLISMIPTRKSDVNKFWMGMPFDLELKSYEGNCMSCWKKSLRKLLTIAKENEDWFKWDNEMEKKYENFIPESRKENANIKPPLRFHRGNLTAEKIIEMSKGDFEPARNENFDVIQYEQTELFGYELDSSNGCEESCEAF